MGHTYITSGDGVPQGNFPFSAAVVAGNLCFISGQPALDPATGSYEPASIEDDMEVELRSHILHRADDLERTGLNRAEAERRARIEFGRHQRFKEECDEALGGSFIDALARDVHFSWRVLSKSPGFTIVAVLTLGLAICANSVVFGILNEFILRPLNVPEAESL